MSTAAAGFAAAVLGVCGCAVPGPGDPLPLQATQPFSSSGEAPLYDRWWVAFDDELLNERVDHALAENFTLMAAWQRLQQAQAIARRERAGQYPLLDGLAVAERLERSDGNDASQLTFGLEMSYEVDLWGRIESAVDAERFRAAATAADYKTAAISLSAEVAQTWYELVVARLQRVLIESQLDTNQTVLDVLERRFGIGQSGSADVLRQRQLVEATREQIIVARSLIEVREHELAVLIGQPPQQSITHFNPQLPRVPDMPAAGLPAVLLQRRPDVVSAFLQLRAAYEDVAVAVADQYPRIDLSASLVTAAENPSDLLKDWLISIAGQIVAPVVDGGQRRAEVQRNVALRQQRLAEYGQVVLDAFREVEDALAQEANQVFRIQSLQAQLTLADRTYDQLRTQYLNGAADYIDVLTALSQQQQIERDLLTARLDRITFRIALYRALAGGFDTPREARTTRQGTEGNEHDDGEVTSG